MSYLLVCAISDLIRKAGGTVTIVPPVWKEELIGVAP